MANENSPITLFLVCDVSGSMAENGKSLLLRGIARAIEQYVRFDCSPLSLKLIFWRHSATVTSLSALTFGPVIDWSPDEEFPKALWDCSLWLAENPTHPLSREPRPLNCKFIIITDGWWHSDAPSMSRAITKISPTKLRIIKIGADANPSLKEDAKMVFSSDDLFAALDGFLPPRASEVLGS